VTQQSFSKKKLKETGSLKERGIDGRIDVKEMGRYFVEWILLV
jgi:hypothetical protein